jgi:hypothetical protein
MSRHVDPRAHAAAGDTRTGGGSCHAPGVALLAASPAPRPAAGRLFHVRNVVSNAASGAPRALASEDDALRVSPAAGELRVSPGVGTHAEVSA